MDLIYNIYKQLLHKVKPNLWIFGLFSSQRLLLLVTSVINSFSRGIRASGIIASFMS